MKSLATASLFAAAFALFAAAPHARAQGVAQAPAPATAEQLRASMLASDSILVTRIEVSEHVSTDSAGNSRKDLVSRRVAVNQVKGPWMKRFVANFLPSGVVIQPQLCPPPHPSGGLEKPWMLSTLWVDKDGRGQAYLNLGSGCGFAGLAGGRPGGVDITAHVDSLLALFQQALFADTALARVSPLGLVDTTHAAAAKHVETNPEAVTKVPPSYPDSARAAGIEGEVLVKALVGKDGVVKQAEISRSVPGLDSAALAAVRQWRFKPATADGVPVAVWVSIPVRFRLKGDQPNVHH